MDVKGAPMKPSSIDMANGDMVSVSKRFNRSNSLQDKTPTSTKAATATARRLRSISISEPQPTKAQPKFSKNSRKSRSGFGRGLPKKGEYSQNRRV